MFKLNYTPKSGIFFKLTSFNFILEFVNLRFKMNLVFVCDAFELIPKMSYLNDVQYNLMENSVARFQIKLFKHNDYVSM